jgi:phage-related protein
VLSPLISAIEIITENFSVFATVVVAATAAVVAYKIAMNFSSIVEGVTKALTAAKTAVLDVNAAMAANPIGAVITLLAALAAALITAYNTSDTFRTKVNSAFSKVKEGAQSLVIKLKSIPLAFKNIVDIVKKLLSGESVDLSSYVWSYAETTEGMWEAYNNKVADIREKHAASVAEAASVVVTTVEDAGEDIESSIKSTADTATSTSSTTTATVLSDAEKIKNAYSGSILETISNFFSNLKSKNWSGVGSALVTIGWGQISASQRKTLTAWALKSLTTINEAYESDGLVGLIETADNLLAGVADYLTENSDTLATGIRGIFDGIVETTKSDGKSILSSLYSIGESIVKITSTSFPEASETISGVVTSIGTWGSAILSFVQANWVGLLVAAVVLLVNSLVTLWDTSDGFRDWTANIKKSISKVFSTVKEVVENFIKALPKTIKILLNAIPQALKWLVGEALPAAIKWIFGELLPMLIEALGDIIAELLEYVLSGQAFTDMLEIGVTLISSLIDGIFYAIPKIGSSLLTAIGKIVSSIGQAFKDLWSNILSIGENIVKGIFEGFTNGVKSLWQGIKDVCAGIVDGIKEFFGIHSPSTMFRDEVGQYMALGIGEGFEKAIPQTIRDMQDELDGVTASLNTTLTPALAGIGETSGTSTDISSLYALLNAYLPALANMQVVLDGGALVGELAPQMDMQLGRIAMRKERGN